MCRGRGFWVVPQAPPWSITNIKCVAANIMHVVAEIMSHVAIIQCCMASILSKVLDILHLQHHFFWNFCSSWITSSSRKSGLVERSCPNFTKIGPAISKASANLMPSFLLVGIKLKGDKKKTIFSQNGKISLGKISFKRNLKKIKIILTSLRKGI